MLATASDESLRDGARAVELARGVNQATGGRVPQVLDALAAALAANGEFEEAVRVAASAVELAAAQGQQALAQEIRARGEGYRQRRPFRLD